MEDKIKKPSEVIKDLVVKSMTENEKSWHGNYTVNFWIKAILDYLDSQQELKDD